MRKIQNSGSVKSKRRNETVKNHEVLHSKTKRRRESHMRVRTIGILATVVLSLVFAACIEKAIGPVAGKTVIITGKVLNSETQAPIAGAAVSLKNPPLSTTTDSTGSYRFTFEADSSYSTEIVTLRSGYAADTVRVSLEPGKSVTRNIALKAVPVTGLPDQGHFTMSVARRNFHGLVSLDAVNTVFVRVGDKFGNPVLPGTRLTFNTRGGTIDGSALTNASGFAQASLYGGNPQPVDPVYGRGYTWVRASALGEEGRIVQDSLLVLFSGTTQIVGPASGFTLQDGGMQQFEYSIADENGNPLVGGTSIGVNVSGSSDVRLGGDINVTLPDTQDKNRYTRFSFTLTDTRPSDSGRDQELAITISVSSNNGNKTYTFTGKLLAPEITGGGGSGPAATIALVQMTRTAISVREVGGDETSIVTYEVRDSLGRPVDQAHQVTVSFFFQGNPGGGEFISPSSALTEAQTGRVRTTVNSGYKAGVLQIVAQATIGSRTIRSAPVIINIFGGFPVASHFSVGASKLNFPGYDRLGERNTISVLAGDKYSNPVKPGTAIYFSTTGGIINIPATAYTNSDGEASATLISGNPRPNDPVLGLGFARVSASTVGELGETVSDTVIVLFSGTSQITGVSPTTFAVPAGGTSGPITFTVSDQNGNPLSQGTSIRVTLQYTPPPNTTINLTVTGDVDVTLGDTQLRGAGTTQFTFRVVDQTIGGVPTSVPVTVVISVTSPNGNPPHVTLNGTVG
jgi:hypothetical protein